MLRILLRLGLLCMALNAYVPAFGEPAYQGCNARAYLLKKCAESSVLFLGTTHKQPAILSMIADVLPDLTQTGVTHLALEIASDQQESMDAFLDGIDTDLEVKLAAAIDCPQYRKIFQILKALPAEKRPKVRAVDLPLERFGGAITRDQWMADQLDRLFQTDDARKIVAIFGSLHVFRQLDWESDADVKPPSIRSQLAYRYPDADLISIINIVGDPESECDFGRWFFRGDTPMAFDLDSRFAGWRLGVSQLIAIVPAEPWTLAEGVIIY